MKMILAHLRALFTRLLELRDSPHAVAGGVAIGVFFGFTPLFGLKTLLSLGTAWLSRCSKIAAVIAVSLHDVVAPFWPVLLRLEYRLGFWLLNQPHGFPTASETHHLDAGELLRWTTFFDVGLPLLVGSVVIAAPASVALYALTYRVMVVRQRHRDRAETAS
jgi:uncharacterized protein (DUF2062 family)